MRRSSTRLEETLEAVHPGRPLASLASAPRASSLPSPCPLELPALSGKCSGSRRPWRGREERGEQWRCRQAQGVQLEERRRATVQWQRLTTPPSPASPTSCTNSTGPAQPLHHSERLLLAMHACFPPQSRGAS
eukprot:1189789-Rhodomonas_salina.1